MAKYTTPQERVVELVRQHGSYRKAAKALGISHPQLHRVRYGEQEPSVNLLRKIGLKPVTKHLRIGS